MVLELGGVEGDARGQSEGGQRHDLSVAVLVVSVLAILLLMLTHLVVTDSLLGSVVVLHLDVDLVVLQPLLQLLEGVQVTLNRDGSVLRTRSRKR